MPPIDATPWIHEQLAPSPGTSTRVLLHAGTLEGTTPHHIDTAAERLRAIGHAATATPFTGGHEPLCWRAALVQAIREHAIRTTLTSRRVHFADGEPNTVPA